MTDPIGSFCRPPFRRLRPTEIPVFSRCCAIRSQRSGVSNGVLTARGIATGKSDITDRQFNIAFAFESSDTGEPAIAQSTFHHFADYNWYPAAGAPSFVSEPPGDALSHSPEARRSTLRYARNLALWLAGRRP